MIQKDLYLNDIFRHIEGVIKADSDSYIAEEVEEYVITNEIEKHLSIFFSEYVQEKFSESVWISGFFGSGKSHLLKILSYVLENRMINGQSCNKIFREKIKKSDFVLESNLMKAAQIPTETILFNIDQKAAAINLNKDTDAILSVFLRVFNEHLGYYGANMFIAEIERTLNEQGLLPQFKDEFLIQTQENWDDVRGDIYFRIEDFAKTYSKIKNISYDEAYNLLDKQYEFTLSIEDFGIRINKYINTKPKGFRLIFCVDEIGQYIAENTKLMLNLQTLAETLQTKTHGKAFLIVTSQNDISSIIKDVKDKIASDFSRIQDRFSIRIDLKSKDVNEVIQKRLLAKNDNAIKELNLIYERDKHNLSTLFRFTDNSRKFSDYNEISYSSTYPFVTYQFDLFQSTMRGLSEHNVFQGKHQSVGERSMMGVFQKVAKKLANENIGLYVDYASIFDGLRSTLKSEVQASIIQAEKNIEDEFTVSVLKALFLVKYVKEFKANLQNITVLMQNSTNNEINSFREKIMGALNLLEAQTYIQRIGDEYEFLTNDEKDVENEIKATVIDDSELANLLQGIIFDEILKDQKVKLDNGNQPYEFGKKLDDVVFGKEKNFFVNFITPFNKNGIDKSAIMMKSYGLNDLIVLLNESDRLIGELNMHLKTDKYIRMKNHTTLKSEIKTIFLQKQEKNGERRRNLVKELIEHIKNAPMYLNGAEITDITVKEPISKIRTAVQKLIHYTYPNLKLLLREFTEDEIKRTILNTNDSYQAEPLNTIENEVMIFLKRKKESSDRVTVRYICDEFSLRPWGWYHTATLCVISSLFKKNKINIKKDSNMLSDKHLLELINKSNEQASLIIEIEEELSSPEIKKLKDFHSEFFHESNIANEPKEISRKFKEKLASELNELNRIKAQSSQFTFLNNLEKATSKMNILLSKEHPYFFKAINSFYDDLLDLKEDIIDPIRQFYNSQQREIYQNIKNYYESNSSNFAFLNDKDNHEIANFLKNETPYLHNFIQQSKSKFDEIKYNINKSIKDEQDKAISKIHDLINQIMEMPNYSKLSEINQEKLIDELKDQIKTIEKDNFIANIRQKSDNIQHNLYPKLMGKMEEWVLVDSKWQMVDGELVDGNMVDSGRLMVDGELVDGKWQIADGENYQPSTTNYQPSTINRQPSATNYQPSTTNQIPATYLSIKTIDFGLRKSVIENEGDVLEYVENIKSKLIELLKENKKITL